MLLYLSCTRSRSPLCDQSIGMLASESSPSLSSRDPPPPFPLILLFPFSLSLSFSFPFLPDSESPAIQLERGARVQVDRCRNFHRSERDGERTRKRVKKREWVYKTDTTFIWQNVCRTYRLAIREFLKFCKDFRTLFFFSITNR